MASFLSHSPEETEKFGATFAGQLKKGDVVALCGDLGSGKTCFVKGMFKGLGGSTDFDVTSPTFTLMHEYPMEAKRLYHLDLYRLENFEQFKGAGLLDFMEPDGMTVVEWADKIPEIEGLFTCSVSFSILNEKEREIRTDDFPLKQ